MTAFLVERLYATGWRRAGEIYWRLSDAERESKRTIRGGKARGVRIIPVQIGTEAVVELFPDSPRHTHKTPKGGSRGE